MGQSAGQTRSSVVSVTGVWKACHLCLNHRAGILPMERMCNIRTALVTVVSHAEGFLKS